MNGGSHPAEGEFLGTRGGGQFAGNISACGARLQRRSLQRTELSLPHSFWLISTILKKCRCVNGFLWENWDVPLTNNQRADA
jgi:hypothetical protein